MKNFIYFSVALALAFSCSKNSKTSLRHAPGVSDANQNQDQTQNLPEKPASNSAAPASNGQSQLAPSTDDVAKPFVCDESVKIANLENVEKYKYFYCGILYRKDYLSPGIGGYVPQVPTLCTIKDSDDPRERIRPAYVNLWIEGADKEVTALIDKILEKSATTAVCVGSNITTPMCPEGCPLKVESIKNAN